MIYKTQKGRNIRRTANSTKYDLFYAISYTIDIEKKEVDVASVAKEFRVTKKYVEDIIMMCELCIFSITEHREDIEDELRGELWDKYKGAYIKEVLA